MIGLIIEYYLYITHTQTLEQKEFLRNGMQQVKRTTGHPVLMLFLSNEHGVEVKSSGTYYTPEDII